MKKQLFIALALLMGVSIAQNAVAQSDMRVNTIIVNGSGDVVIRQGDYFECIDEDGYTINNPNVQDSVLTINGHKDYEVVVEELNYITINSSGDVVFDGTMRGGNLFVDFNSSGDSKLNLDYDNVFVIMNGSGDLVLRGDCNTLLVESHGSGDLVTKKLNVHKMYPGGIPNLEGLSELLAELGTNLEHLGDSVDWKSFERDMKRWGKSMEEWGRHVEEWSRQVESQSGNRQSGYEQPKAPEKSPEEKPKEVPQEEQKKKSLLFNPHWNGVDAGLNMLLATGSTGTFETPYTFLELKPLKSWVFNFNIVDVGIAFSRSHVVGLYTGIGLGWNNYSLNNPVRLIKGDQHIECEWLNDDLETHVKNSKLGVLYVQAPFMLEVRPTRKFFLAAGVTAGFRTDVWTKVKFTDKTKEKKHSDYYVNPLKLDATFRAGGNSLGFFASYNLLSLFNTPESHTLCFGVSLLF